MTLHFWQIHQLKPSLCSIVWSIQQYLHANADKIEYMCFNQKGNTSKRNGGSLKLEDKFTNCRSSISSTENGINELLAKVWTAINRLLIIWMSSLSDKIKCNFFQTAVVLILLYGCTTWMLTKCIEKKLDRNSTRMLQVILNKSWKQHPTKQQLYGHLPPISKTIEIRWTRNVGHCWRSKNKPVSDVLLWTFSCRRASVGQPTKTYLQQLFTDTGCSLEDLPEAMDEANGKWESRKSMRAAWHDDDDDIWLKWWKNIWCIYFFKYVFLMDDIFFQYIFLGGGVIFLSCIVFSMEIFLYGFLLDDIFSMYGFSLDDVFNIKMDQTNCLGQFFFHNWPFPKHLDRPLYIEIYQQINFILQG